MYEGTIHNPLAFPGEDGRSSAYDQFGDKEGDRTGVVRRGRECRGKFLNFRPWAIRVEAKCGEHLQTELRRRRPWDGIIAKAAG